MDSEDTHLARGRWGRSVRDHGAHAEDCVSVMADNGWHTEDSISCFLLELGMKSLTTLPNQEVIDLGLYCPQEWPL